jgi:hypothetical protein
VALGNKGMVGIAQIHCRQTLGEMEMVGDAGTYWDGERHIRKVGMRRTFQDGNLDAESQQVVRNLDRSLLLRYEEDMAYSHTVLVDNHNLYLPYVAVVVVVAAAAVALRETADILTILAELPSRGEEPMSLDQLAVLQVLPRIEGDILVFGTRSFSAINSLKYCLCNVILEISKLIKELRVKGANTYRGIKSV